MSERVIISPDRWEEALLEIIAGQKNDQRFSQMDLIVRAAKLLGHPRPHPQIPAARNALGKLVKEKKVQRVSTRGGAQLVAYQSLIPVITNGSGAIPDTPHILEVSGQILALLGQKVRDLEASMQRLELENNELRESYAAQGGRLDALTLALQQIKEELNELLPDVRQFAAIKGATLQALLALRDGLGETIITDTGETVSGSAPQ